jgi:hypothetical protein
MNQTDAKPGFRPPCYPELDETDRRILADRRATFDALSGPRCGDYVRFACGRLRRISHLWDDGVQTSHSGSWYLGQGFADFSGSLFSSVPNSTLQLTDELQDGEFWFFSHDCWQAHNGVDFTMPCRVYSCSRPAPEA